MMRLPDSPDLVIMGDPLLFQQHQQICVDDILTDDFQHNLQTLRNRQIEANGIGIAAPQIGWGARVLCIGVTEETKSRYPAVPDIPLSFWINPQIIEVSQETCWTWEGCLSVPGIRGWVNRPANLKVRGFDGQGNTIEAVLNGFAARVMLHEIDHLNGILFPERVDETTLMVPNISMENQSRWPENWPTINARMTPPGMISAER
ncbi:peptide deformylase [Salinisphaera sp. G21_0]|uniref:peptide deformylase n=1 Tax=Salinisphaera sp. G21_0 TaxID=2821094 RepID=UPI001ADBB568|nr:peptide deformylase [Salinisphaera sp. G21_0]MBO9480451.1 peptide deformylase [Salinisphaera sp. G21_0]